MKIRIKPKVKKKKPQSPASKQMMKAYKANPQKFVERSRKWRKEHPDYHKGKWENGHLMWRYGITLDDKKALMKLQKGLCFLCGRNFEKEDLKSVIDHCHKTGFIRGILCFRCNLALSGLGDTVEHLQRAVKYLKGKLQPDEIVKRKIKTVQKQPKGNKNEKS